MSWRVGVDLAEWGTALRTQQLPRLAAVRAAYGVAPINVPSGCDVGEFVYEFQDGGKAEEFADLMSKAGLSARVL